jgi:hypothetical protein
MPGISSAVKLGTVSRRAVVLSVIGVVLVAAVAVAFVLRLARTEPAPAVAVSAAPVPTSPGAPAPPLDQARAKQLSADLASATADGMRDAIALPSGQELSSAAGAQLKAQGPITFDVATFRDHGDGTASVVAHAAATNGTWTVTLIDESAKWKMSLTEKSS